MEWDLAVTGMSGDNPPKYNQIKQGDNKWVSDKGTQVNKACEKQWLGAGLVQVKEEMVENNINPGKGDLPTWNNFTQNTTFHGIRYIFDKDAIRFRR